MKKSKFTDSQIIDALKRAQAGLAVPALCRELGIKGILVRLAAPSSFRFERDHRGLARAGG